MNLVVVDASIALAWCFPDETSENTEPDNRGDQRAHLRNNGSREETTLRSDEADTRPPGDHPDSFRLIHPWNHNIHYHGIVLRAASPQCKRALDVGCGQGLLARQLARQCQEVVAIDVDHDTQQRGRASGKFENNIAFVEGDVMTHLFPDSSFDLITAVATLTHRIDRFPDA